MIINDLIKGRLVKRYKRFLADVDVGGEIFTAHCPNSGSMKSLLRSGNYAYITKSDDPKRKLQYTLQFIGNDNWVACVNTMLPNKIVYESILDGTIPLDYDIIKREVKYGNNSRIDIYLEKNGSKTFLEVKNVTLMEEDAPGIAQFPDAITTRGQKHLKDLCDEAKEGNKAIMLYLVNRSNCSRFKVANHIDKDYYKLFKRAEDCGVEIIAYKSNIEVEDYPKMSGRISVGEKLKILG